jgi:K+-sensing histidine kinase KdpD
VAAAVLLLITAGRLVIVRRQIAAMRRQAEEARLEVEAGLPTGLVVDTDRMLERFLTTGDSRSDRTSGLRLSIVQVLVEQIDGTVQGHHDPSAATPRSEVRVPVSDY